MDKLSELHHKYRQQLGDDDSWTSLKGLYAKYVKEREQTILDAAASGAALSSILSADQIDFDKVTPQMEEAFHLAYPNVDMHSIANMDAEQLTGIISGWKGKLFEVDVRDRLNAGEWVGDLHLEPGQTAELAASVTQPGWDLAIHGADGSVLNEIQLKATESLSYIKHALERYPDTHVLTTAEISDVPDHLSHMVSVSDISDDQLTEMVSAPLSDSLSDSLLDTLLPGLPLALIGLTEGYGAITGKRTQERAVQRAVSRTGKGLLAGAIGWGIGALFGDFTGVLGGMAARFFMGGEQDEPEPVIIEADYYKMDERMKKAQEIPQMLLPYYG